MVTSLSSSAEASSDDVAAARAGDAAAFARLYRRVQPPLLRYLTGLVGADAQDVASETWLQVSRDLGSFRGDGDAFTGWVVTIGRHRALDLKRRAARRPLIADQTFVQDPSSAWAERAADAADVAAEVAATRRALALIAGLPIDQAEAVLLRVVVGLDAPAAAKILGKRPGAVRMATSRGLSRLRKILEQQDEGLEPGSSVTLAGPATLKHVR